MTASYTILATSSNPKWMGGPSYITVEIPVAPDAETALEEARKLLPAGEYTLSVKSIVSLFGAPEDE